MNNSTFTLAEAWRRFIAKILDLQIAGFILAITLGILLALFKIKVTPNNLHVGIYILAFISCLIVDALICKLLGNSLGKYLLGIRVIVAETKAPYTNWFTRAFWLWIYGFACGIPLLNFFTFFNCQRLVQAGKQTPYDKKVGVWVIEEKISAIRWATAFILIFLFYLFLKVNA